MFEDLSTSLSRISGYIALRSSVGGELLDSDMLTQLSDMMFRFDIETIEDLETALEAYKDKK